MLRQDPISVAPNAYKVSTENQYVRALDTHIKPGEKTSMHSHPGYVSISLSPCKVRFTSADGKTEDAELNAGDCVWREAETHSVENIGSTECHVLNVEIKAAGETEH